MADQLIDNPGSRSPARLLLEVVESRCRVCRNPTVRRAVNELLDWHGLSVPGGGTIGYQDILGRIHESGAGRSGRDRITYTSLWNHAKRHHDHDAVMAYWTARMARELSEALAKLAATS